MGSPLLRGREFSLQDDDQSPGVVIINEAMARRYWPGQDPVGRHVTIGKRQTLEIVGVVATGKYGNLRESPQPFMWRPFLQAYDPRATVVVQTAGDPKPMLAMVQRAIHELDSNLPVADAETLQQYMAIPLFPAHDTGTLLGAFGLLALALAVVGLSGVIAYSVSQRTQEFGVRMALGGKPSDVLKLVVRQGMVLTLSGVGIGVVVALAVTQVLSSLLYGIRPTDPVTYVAVSVFLTGAALLASYIPARRATKVDPMVALRYE
jgi:predicted permease